jgi:glycosyltransferase involved in cell wall biosynthesis
MAFPKKILFDAERMKHPHTGLYHFCLHLGNALLNKIDVDKEEIDLFIPDNEKKNFKDNANIIPLKSWHKFFLPNADKVDVWHATHQDTAYFPFNKEKAVVLTIHDLNYFHDKNKSEAKKNNFLAELQKKVNQSNHLTFISEYSLNDFKQYINIQHKPYTVIYNGCNIHEVEHLLEPTNKPNTPFIFTIGTITEKKNFHVLPALLHNNSYHLIIAGITQNEAYKKSILDEAVKYNVQDRIIFTGAISENDKQWYYKNCEAFVFPSLAEGFGLPVIEAMYFGKPVFLSTATSLPEVGGAAAYYFTSFEPSPMQQVFENGMCDYSNSNKTIQIKNQAAQFSWQKAADQYLEIYRSLY